MKIGDYNIYSIQTGLFRLDGGAMFGVVPKVMWNRTNPADELNRINMCSRSLLLSNGKQNILIDTGVGTKLPKKLNEIYSVDYTDFTLENSLKKHGFKREDITDVILTHLHFDHAGGNTYYGEGREVKLAFPNAIFHVQKKHYEWAINPTDRDKASFFPENYLPLEQNKMLKLIDGKHKFDELITLIPVNGHTNNMQMVKISDGEETLLYMADLVPMMSHLPLPYIMGYDLFPLITLEEKRKYLTEAAENKYTLFFEHDPANECAKINMAEKGVSVISSFNLD